MRLTNAVGADTNPAWSPRGDRIAFESTAPSGKPEIYVLNADGSGVPVRLTDFDDEPYPSNPLVTKATWSPDGDRIAFHRRVVEVTGTRGHTQIYTMNADGTDVTQITFTPTPPTPEFSGFPSWGTLSVGTDVARPAFALVWAPTGMSPWQCHAHHRREARTLVQSGAFLNACFTQA